MCCTSSFLISTIWFECWKYEYLTKSFKKVWVITLRENFDFELVKILYNSNSTTKSLFFVNLIFWNFPNFSIRRQSTGPSEFLYTSYAEMMSNSCSCGDDDEGDDDGPEMSFEVSMVTLSFITTNNLGGRTKEPILNETKSPILETGQNSRFRKWDKIADFENETKPPISKMRQNRRLC